MRPAPPASGAPGKVAARLPPLCLFFSPSLAHRRAATYSIGPQVRRPLHVPPARLSLLDSRLPAPAGGLQSGGRHSTAGHSMSTAGRSGARLGCAGACTTGGLAWWGRTQVSLLCAHTERPKELSGLVLVLAETGGEAGACLPGGREGRRRLNVKPHSRARPGRAATCRRGAGACGGGRRAGNFPNWHHQSSGAPGLRPSKRESGRGFRQRGPSENSGNSSSSSSPAAQGGAIVGLVLLLRAAWPAP